ncbi:MAG: hypothetical protein ACLP59_10320 [Bryobacteraceae bacterium]
MKHSLVSRVLGAVAFLTVAGIFFLSPGMRALPSASPKVIVIPELKHGVSLPLRTLAIMPAVLWAQSSDDDDDESPSATGTAISVADPVRQTTAGSPLVAIPGMNLLGLGAGFVGPSGSKAHTGVPPDPNSAVGNNQIVETVNLSLAVFQKTTIPICGPSGCQTETPVLGPMFIGNLWLNFSTACSNGASMADPVVLYDKQADRWVIKMGTLATPYTACLAVSQTSDATGAYNLYTYSFQAEGNLTGQKLATWPDGYYLGTKITYNSKYVGPSACVMDRSQMLIGQAASMQCVQLTNTKLQEMVPANMDGPVPPPAGTPEYFLMLGPSGVSDNTVDLYRFHVDFTTPANTALYGPLSISVAPYVESPNIPQFGATEVLRSNGDIVRPQYQYRNFPNATPPYDALIATHSIVTGSGSTAGVGMRWYEIHNPGGTPVVYQQGTYAPDTNFRWMGAIAMDGAGDIAMGYSVSTADTYPSVSYTGRVPTDPLGTMEAEATIFNGIGNQSDSDRWGDYTSMSVDPADDCTMWYTGQYLAQSESKRWATRLFSLVFPGCQQITAQQKARPATKPGK